MVGKIHMRFLTPVALWVVFSVQFPCSWGQTSGPRISVENAFVLVRRLTSPEMEGRRSGTSGGVRAAAFIAQKFREYGLEPRGDNGTYFQTYTFPMFDFTGPCRFAVIQGGKARYYTYGTDFQIENLSDGGRAEEEVIFVGYGMSADGFDEYSSVDVRGKIVMALEGTPQNVNRRWPEGSGWDSAKTKEAARHGARALLLVPDPDKGKQLTAKRIWGVRKEDWNPNLIVARVDVNVASDLFADSGTQLDILKSQIDRSLIPHSIAIPGKKVRLEAGVTLHPAQKTKNVLGVFPGSDSILKNEVIVIGGHYDHGGRDPTGDIYPGAEDDASGTALVMEIARTLATNHVKLKRTVLFATWAAEEQAYSGDEYYVKHPKFPLEKTAANFWLDNAGIGEGKFNVWGAEQFPEIYDYVNERVDPSLRPEAGFYSVTPFSEFGVPFLFTEAAAPQPFNHTPWDRVSLLSAQALGAIGKYVLEGTIALANAPTGFIGRDRLSRFAIRSAPVFALTPLSVVTLQESEGLLFDKTMQRYGPVIFCTEIDLGVPSLFDDLVHIHRLKDSSGKDVHLANGSNLPHTWGGTSNTAIVLTVDAVSLVSHYSWLDTLEQMGLGALLVRGRGGKLPTEILSTDGSLKPEANISLSSLPLLIQDLDFAEIQKLPRTGKPFVLVDAVDLGRSSSRYSPTELRALAASGTMLGVRFPCSVTNRGSDVAQDVATEIINLKQTVGADRILLNPRISPDPNGTSLQSVVEVLLARGWTLVDIRKALGENFAQVWQDSTTF